MIRLSCLDYEQSFSGTSSASSAKLLQELQSLFISPEILNAEQGVGSDYSHKAQTAEIKPFGHYLRTDENVYLSFAELPYCLCLVASFLNGVAVQPCYPCLREKCLCLLFYLLCTGSERDQFSAAFAAFARVWAGVAAPMAHQLSAGIIAALMETETDIAVRAFQQLSAVAALHHRSPGPSCPQDDDLLSSRYGLFDMGDELTGKTAFHSVLLPFRTGVNDLYFGVVGSVETLGKQDLCMSSFQAVVELFKRWSR